MSMELRKLVEAELLPLIAHLGIAIVYYEKQPEFDNAYIVLAAPTIRLEVLRDRGVIFTKVGPVSDKSLWFDSEVLDAFFGLPPDLSDHRDARRVLQHFGAFISEYADRLIAMLNGPKANETIAELKTFRNRRAAKAFGFEAT